MKKVSTRALALGAVALLSAGLLSACGDDEGENKGDGGANNSDQGDAGSGNNGENPDEEGPALYAVATQLQVGTDSVSYVILSEDLKSEFKIDDAVVEIEGRGIAAGAPGSGQFFIAPLDKPELTRYVAVEKDGKWTVKKDETISFLPQGLTGFSGYGAQFQFIDSDKAYWFAREGKLVVWDPEALELVKGVDLSELVFEGENLSYTGAPVRVGDTLYSFAGWDTREQNVVKVSSRTAVVAVNTKSDAAEVILDTRCGYVRDGVQDGKWLYLATEGVGTGVHFLNDENGPAPCLLRFDTEKNEFDASYKIELNDLTSAGPVGSLFTAPSGEAFLYVLDVEKYNALDAAIRPSNPRVLSSAQLWHTAQLSVGETPSLKLLDNPLTSASILPFTLKNDVKVAATYDPSGETSPRIWEVTKDGLVGTEKVNAPVPGTVFSILQIK